MSPIDINVPTRCAVVLVSKDSFVSLVTNLNSKNNVCKQWCLLLRFKLLTRFWILCSLLACKTMYLFPQVWAQKDQSQEKNFKSTVWWNISFWGKKLTTEEIFFYKIYCGTPNDILGIKASPLCWQRTPCCGIIWYLKLLFIPLLKKVSYM